jgi:hypothetical protein
MVGEPMPELKMIAQCDADGAYLEANGAYLNIDTNNLIVAYKCPKCQAIYFNYDGAFSAGRWKATIDPSEIAQLQLTRQQLSPQPQAATSFVS